MKHWCPSESAPEALCNFELAQEVAHGLTGAGIDFCIFSGSHAALLGGHRSTPDIDFWADHRKWDELVAAFPYAEVTDRRETWKPGDPYDGVLLTFGSQGEVAIMSGTIIHADGRTYPSSFTELVRQNRVYTRLGGLMTWFANPADTLLFKAISQRGRDQGKHDIDDIIAISRSVTIDKPYLLQRIIECRAQKRAIPLLLHLGVLEKVDLAGI